MGRRPATASGMRKGRALKKRRQRQRRRVRLRRSRQSGVVPVCDGEAAALQRSKGDRLRKKAAQEVGGAGRLFFAGLKPCASTEGRGGDGSSSCYGERDAGGARSKEAKAKAKGTPPAFKAKRRRPRLRRGSRRTPKKRRRKEKARRRWVGVLLQPAKCGGEGALTKEGAQLRMRAA